MEISYLKGVIKEQNFGKGTVEFNESQLINLHGREIKPEIRSYGSFKGKAFYLHSFFDWIIVRDNNGNLCLVPLRKEGEEFCL